ADGAVARRVRLLARTAARRRLVRRLSALPCRLSGRQRLSCASRRRPESHTGKDAREGRARQELSREPRHRRVDRGAERLEQALGWAGRLQRYGGAAVAGIQKDAAAAQRGGLGPSRRGRTHLKGSAFKQAVTAADIKTKARGLGADLVGIADGATLECHPPDPRDPRRPSDITDLDGGRVIVLAKRLSRGTARIAAWNDRHKYYNDELALSRLEEASLELVYWLEDNGYPAIIVPPTHVDPWRYDGDPKAHHTTLLSLPHAAVEAGLGTLGLNLQLLTPEFGPRVLLTAVLCSIDVACDQKIETALCLGPSCGRCLKTCPADAVGHWTRDWPACDRFR